ncbi:metallophosphoesterase [Candidatus Auribacterota bacterium]
MRKNNKAYLHLLFRINVPRVSVIFLLIAIFISPNIVQALAPESPFDEFTDKRDEIVLSGPVNKNGVESGHKIGAGMHFPAYASALDVIQRLTRNNVKFAGDAGNAIEELQSYLMTIAARSPQLPKDSIYFEIEFRRDVANYVSVKGGTVIVDVELLKVAPKDLKPLLAFLLWDKADHVIKPALDRKDSYILNADRFAALNSYNQLSVWNALKALKARPGYIKELESRFQRGVRYIVEFMRKTGLKDDLSGEMIFGRSIRQWAEDNRLLYDHHHLPGEKPCRKRREILRYNKLMNKLIDENTPLEELIDFIIEYAAAIDDREMLNSLTDIIRKAGGDEERLRHLLTGPAGREQRRALRSQIKARPKRKMAAFQRLGTIPPSKRTEIDSHLEFLRKMMKDSPLYKAAEGYCFRDVRMQHAGKLFNEFDIGGMALLKAPLWPVDGKGEIRDDLIEWMKKPSGTPSEEYFLAGKKSLLEIIGRIVQIPFDDSKESIRLFMLDIAGVIGDSKIVKTTYLKVPKKWIIPGDYGKRVGEFIDKIKTLRVQRIVAIGDIHGNIFRLNQILEMIEARQVDEVVFLGDYINRDAGSIKVLERVKGLVKADKAKALLGNHEARLISLMFGEGPTVRQTCIDWVWGGGWVLMEELGIANELKKKGIDLKAKEMGTVSGSGEFERLLNELRETLNDHYEEIIPAIRNNPILRDRALWMLKNLKFYYIDANNTFYVHGGVPIDGDGIIDYSFRGRTGFEAVQEFQRSLDGIREKLLKVDDFKDAPDREEIVRFISEEGFHKNRMLNKHKWFEDAGSPEKALNVLRQLGALRVVTGHSPQSKEELKEMEKYSGSINVIDFGISREEAQSFEGGFLILDENGVVIHIYHDPDKNVTLPTPVTDIDGLMAQAKWERSRLVVDNESLRGDEYNEKSMKDNVQLSFVESGDMTRDKVLEEVKNFGLKRLEGRTEEHGIRIGDRLIAVIIEKGSELRINTVMELLGEALEAMKGSGRGAEDLPDTLVFSVLDSSSHIFEDHLQNGIIGINRYLYAIRDPDMRNVLLRIGIFHELCHELSPRHNSLFEDAQIGRDARFAVELMENIPLAEENFGRMLRVVFGSEAEPFVKAMSKCRRSRPKDELEELRLKLKRMDRSNPISRASILFNNEVRGSTVINGYK